MRSFLIPTLTAAALVAAAAPALAQNDRYGGYAAYPDQSGQPVTQVAPAQPSRILTWPGKTIPVAPPVQAQPQGYAAPYGYPVPATPYPGRPMYPATYSAPQPPRAYAPVPQQQLQPQPRPQPQQAAPQLRPTVGYNAPPQGRPYPAQPYYAAPAAPMPAPGSTATAPNGVYPPGVVPPQLAYPMGVQPQMNGQIVGPQSQQSRQPALPTSIYAPPPPAPQAAVQPAPPANLGSEAHANPADPRQPQRVAMNTAAPAKSARLYSVHREFGLAPDPTPAAAPEGQPVELVSPIDSPAPNPDGEVDRPDSRRVTDASGKTTVVRTRSASSNAD